jgi:hypothetical protein
MGAGLGIALVASGDAQAASVGCTPRSSHPICRANYAAHPKGALAPGQRSTGSAVVNGKTVSWTCLGGASSNPPMPRRCTY